MKMLKFGTLTALLLAPSVLACGGEELDDEALDQGESFAVRGVDVNLKIISDWRSGYCANVALKNSSSAAVTDWSAVIALNGSKLTSIWSAKGSVAGGLLTATPQGFNKVMAAGASASFGFCASSASATMRPSVHSLEITGGGAPPAPSPGAGAIQPPTITRPLGSSCPAKSFPYTTGTGASYHVAVNGDDRAVGDQDRPFATIGRCAAVAQAGDSCVIHGGTYRETLKPLRSGTASQPITFRAAAGERPIISAADRISGLVLASGQGGKPVYRATMPWTLNNATRPAGTDQVFVNGVALTEARWPNLNKPLMRTTRADWAKTTAGEVGSMTSPGLASLPDASKQAAYITALPGALWTIASGKVTAASGTTIKFKINTHLDDVYYAPKANNYFYLFGTRALLDAPGEWSRDADGSLYIWSPDGRDLSGAMAEAKRRDTAIDLGAVSHVRVVGFEVRGGRIVTGKGTQGIVLDRLAIHHPTHALFQDRAWGGGVPAIALNASKSMVLNSLIEGSAFGGIEMNSDGSASGNTVANCAVLDNNYTGANPFGVSIPGSGHTIYGNRISGFGTGGLLDMRDTQSSDASCNEISDGGHMTSDGGLVMITRGTDGKGTRLHHNYIHHGSGEADQAQMFYGTSGFYTEGSVKNFVIDHNIIDKVGCGICLGPGPEGAVQGFKVYNNTVMGNLGTNWSWDYDHEGTVVANNFFMEMVGTFKTITLQNNLVLKNGGNSTIADPMLNSDYTPKPGSPLIGKGLSIPPYTGSKPVNVGAR